MAQQAEERKRDPQADHPQTDYLQREFQRVIPRIRVLVVEPHAAVCHALASLVASQDDMILVGAVASYEEALQVCAQTDPDVILIAITANGNSAAPTLRAILDTWSSIRILGMSSFQEEDYIPGVLQAGAVGYLLKNVTGEELVSSIRLAYVTVTPPAA